jgi:hypothetical protein
MKHLPGRTENMVKNRFNCMFRKLKDETIQRFKDNDMDEALSKLQGKAS